MNASNKFAAVVTIIAIPIMYLRLQATREHTKMIERRNNIEITRNLAPVTKDPN